MNNEWDDNEFPLAYLLTFRTYGTWHHGDARGAVDRRSHNTFGTVKMPASSQLVAKEKVSQRSLTFAFDEEMRSAVDEAIRNVCKHRSYDLFAVNVRTNHVHAVASGVVKPEKIIEGFKSYSTRALRLRNLVKKDARVWSRHGSTRYLWSDRAVTAAIDYVLYSQGDEFPNFEEMVG